MNEKQSGKSAKSAKSAGGQRKRRRENHRNNMRRVIDRENHDMKQGIIHVIKAYLGKCLRDMKSGRLAASYNNVESYRELSIIS